MNLEFKNRTIDTLVLGFQKPIKYNLPIPDSKIILESFQFSITKLFGDKYPIFQDRHFSDFSDFFKEPVLKYILEPIKEIRKKVKSALIDVLRKESGCGFMGGYWDDSHLEYAFNNFQRYEQVIFPGLGSLYKFKEEINKVEKEVRKHFNEAEMKNFYQLHEHMRTYVDNQFNI